jgi:hypothetical protein
MTEIGYRGKIGTGHSKLGFRSGCGISERRITYSHAKTDHVLNWLPAPLRIRTKDSRKGEHLLRRSTMKCQRCLLGLEAKYRVYTDVLDMKVCEVCADEARKLGIAVEALDDGKVKNYGTVSGALASV